MKCKHDLPKGIRCEECFPVEQTGSKSAPVEGSKACCYEATTIVILRIVAFMQAFQTDAEIVLNEFVGEMGEYETELARREGITIKP